MNVQGIAAARGIAIAKAVIMNDVKVKQQHVGTAAEELGVFQHAVEQAKTQVEALHAQTTEKLGADEAQVFTAHRLVLDDPEYIGAITAQIEAGMSATAAIESIQNQFVELFLALADDYMKERAADVKDVSQRISQNITGQVNTLDYNEPSILIAHDLTPSHTAQLDKTFTYGFITEKGGKTSHSAIFARSLQIPAIVGAATILKHVQHGDVIVMDGDSGQIFINPNDDVLADYKQRQLEQQQQQQQLEALRDEKTKTRDGHIVELGANIGSVADAKQAVALGAEGVGLFRTEFLYLERDTAPTEDEQFTIYRDVLKTLGERPVVVRTLDIGGDKEVPYLNMAKEDNPFLGLRAIRLCFSNETLFRTQLRALLRAARYGNLKIMFPMIASVEEFRQAKQWLIEEQQKLEAEEVDVGAFELGIMIEIPSAAILAPVFAEEVDFFSIGTNDLIQYTLAVDRMNESISHLYEPFHPAIVTLLKLIIDSAHAKGKWVGVCGEMAGDEAAIPLLLALGLDEFSMSAPSILRARAQIHALAIEDLHAKLQLTFQQPTAERIREIWIN